MKIWNIIVLTIFFYLFTSFAANACPDMLAVSPGDNIPCNGFFINETRTDQFLKMTKEVDKLEKDLLNQQGINYLLMEENRLLGTKIDKCEEYAGKLDKACDKEQAWEQIKFMGIGISLGVLIYAFVGR